MLWALCNEHVCNRRCGFVVSLQVNQLSGLIELINGDLSKLDRKKLITLCTIDVHARDVLQRLIGESALTVAIKVVARGGPTS